MFFSRRREGTDHYLDWKVRLFFLGAALALAGIGLDSSLVVGLALAVFVAGFALRFFPGTPGGPDQSDSDEG